MSTCPLNDEALGSLGILRCPSALLLNGDNGLGNELVEIKVFQSRHQAMIPVLWIEWVASNARFVLCVNDKITPLQVKHPHAHHDLVKVVMRNLSVPAKKQNPLVNNYKKTKTPLQPPTRAIKKAGRGLEGAAAPSHFTRTLDFKHALVICLRHFAVT